MTAIPRDDAPARQPGSAAELALGRIVAAARTSPGLIGTMAVAAVLYTWNLTVSGYANLYYSAAALAASKSWSAWFFGSFDPANFITVDKPPLSTMAMGLSVRLLGLSSGAILLPEAVAGVLTVGMLYLVVRRQFGTLAAVLASLVMALTPAAVLIFRFNNPDALLTLLLVASAYALVRSLDRGSLRWVALAGALVGLAFLTKYLQAYLVLPAYALVFGFSARATLRRRVAGLVVALVAVLLVSGWWVAIVSLLPAGSRPFIGGSTTGSVLDLIFGYDGLGRLFGQGGGGGGGGGGGFGGTVGLLRLFDDQFFGEIAWFIPLAAASLVLISWLRRHATPSDRGVAGSILWGGWFTVHVVVFSYMSGIVHSYYAVALAPAVAALAGAGVADLWARRRTWLGSLGLGIALVGTAIWGALLMARTPTFVPWVGPAAVALAVAASIALLASSLPQADSHRLAAKMAGPALVLGIIATLLAPGAYAAATVGTAYSSGDPHPGPATASDRFGGPGGFGGGTGGFAGAPGVAGAAGGAMPESATAGPGAPSGPIGGQAPGGPGMRSDTNATLVGYLLANRGAATWIVAVSGADQAGAIELASGEPVMAMGGFTGSDPTPTLAQLQAYIAAGELRFVIAGNGFGGGPSGFAASDANSVSSWVTSTCRLIDSTASGSSNLYDCAGAA